MPLLEEVYVPDVRPHLTVGVDELNVVHEMSMAVGSWVAARCPWPTQSSPVTNIILHWLALDLTCQQVNLNTSRLHAGVCKAKWTSGRWEARMSWLVSGRRTWATDLSGLVDVGVDNDC